MNKRWVFLTCTLFVLFLPGLTIRSQNCALLQKEESGEGILGGIPLEMAISRRMSIRSFNLTAAVPWELVSKVLWAAYGYSWRGRTILTFSGYPIIIYVCNETAAYKFVPENQSLALWKEGDYRGLGKGSGWSFDAPIQLCIILDANICPDILWGNAESGCAIQNIYLMANALNLGTVCAYPNRTDIHQGLGLPGNENVLYKMPLGYPLPPYANYQNLMPTFRPSSLELPEIQDSDVSLVEALDSIFSSHDWSNNPVTRQELSQILWAGYGYSYYEDTGTSPPTRHRTVPSSGGYYPMKVYAANSSGVYEYLPEQHTLTTIVTGDRRPSIAQASGNAWASSAPLIIALAYVEDSRPYIGGEETYVEVGLITQNVYLESAAWGLIADWGKADIDEEAMREALGLIGETHLHPASIITVGHPSYFNLTITSTEGGTTDPVPGTYNYQATSSVNVTAIPSSGYSFDYWLLDGEERTENPITVIMDTNHTLEAVFVDDIPPEISVPVQEPLENVVAYQNVTVTVNVTEVGSGLYNITLWYSTNNGTTWTPLNMTEISTSIYQTTIPGHENCTWVTYKIIAYDNNGNEAINDNHGYCYIYHVIPEFPSALIMPLFMTTTLLAVIIYRGKHSKRAQHHPSEND
jgi:SagB-type dehydrogenase family enzyme